MSRKTQAREKTRYWYSIWGKAPGWGFESGWAFGETPQAAVESALADAKRFGPKFKLPADVHLQSDEESAKYFSFHVDADGKIRKFQTSSEVREAMSGALHAYAQSVEDYLAVDRSGRPVGGPFPDYDTAKKKADRTGGYVKFVTGEAAEPESSERSDVRNYEFVVYPSTRHEGEGVKVPGSFASPKSLRAAIKVAKDTYGPGAGIYSVTRGAWEGWINHNGRYVSFHRVSEQPFATGEASEAVNEPIRWEPSGGGTGFRGTGKSGETYLLRRAGGGRWNLHIKGKQYGPYSSLDVAKNEASHMKESGPSEAHALSEAWKKKKGKYGTLYLFRVVYRDKYDPGFGQDSWHTWAYDEEHAENNFWEGPDAEGWEIVSVNRVKAKEG
jgi:hypothetical protein